MALCAQRHDRCRANAERQRGLSGHQRRRTDRTYRRHQSNVARVFLATDLNSRIPVQIGPNAVRGILAGDNSSRPKIIYVPEGANIAVGDDVATSAQVVFPAGLRLGTLAGNLSDPRVQLRADLDRLDYVSVLFFADPRPLYYDLLM